MVDNFNGVDLITIGAREEATDTIVTTCWTLRIGISRLACRSNERRGLTPYGMSKLLLGGFSG